MLNYNVNLSPVIVYIIDSLWLHPNMHLIIDHNYIINYYMMIKCVVGYRSIYNQKLG